MGSSGELCGLLLGPGLQVSPSLLQRSLEAELGVDALDAVGRVDVLDENDLVAGSGALARGNGGPCKEEEPDL